MYEICEGYEGKEPADELGYVVLLRIDSNTKVQRWNAVSQKYREQHIIYLQQLRAQILGAIYLPS
jgi:hypothetical protein